MQQDITPKQLRSFGFIVGGIFVIIGLWPALWRDEALRVWALALGGLLLLPAVAYPRIYAGHIRAGWRSDRCSVGSTRGLFWASSFMDCSPPWGW